MMCTKFQNHIFAYIDGDLSADLHLELTEHLEDCHACQAELSLWDHNAQWDMLEVDWSISESVMNRIRQEDRWAYSITEQIHFISKRMSTWITGFAVGLLLLFTYSFFSVNSDTHFIQGGIHEISFEEKIGSGELAFTESAIASVDSFTVIGMVASIGDPMMISGLNSHINHTLNPIFGLIFIGFVIIILGMNWMNQNIEQE